jgi:cyclophilin family peptidyl-prolyl cis-trans isomerase
MSLLPASRTVEFRVVVSRFDLLWCVYTLASRTAALRDSWEIVVMIVSRTLDLRILALLATMLSAGATAAQEVEPPANASEPPPVAQAPASELSDAAKQAQAVFQEKFAAYKSAIRDIEKLQNDFQTADAATREKLNAEATGQVAHAQSLVNEMVEAGMEAFRLAPTGDPQITEMLTAVAGYRTVGRQIGTGKPAIGGHPEDVYYPIDGGDQYERALPLIKLLIEGGAPDNRLYVWGFLAAFAANDYDLAARWLEKAQQTGALEKIVADSQEAEVRETQAGLAKSLLHQLSVSASVLDEYRSLWAREAALREAEAKANDLPRVKFTTTKGEITIELFENEAPQSVANFLTLVKEGFYNDSPFHRVLPKFMVQGGAKTDDGEGGPGYTIRCECYRQDHRSHFRGSLSMAHAGRDTGNSQFFLTVAPAPHLNGKHTVFGRVIEGMEVLADLQRRSPQHEAVLPKADRILKAEVLRDRGHDYSFEKLPDR